MANDKHTYQVIIVGGGPAGIATALTLHARGIHCCVVEAYETPVRKAGEAIPPNAKPLLKQLGILSLVENEKHTVYYGNKSCWGSDSLQQKEFISDRMGHGFLLDRLHFETQLQETYQKTDQGFYKGFKLKKVVSDGTNVKAIIENSNKNSTLTSDFIIDATGRKASVCRHFNVQKENLDSQFALTFNVKLPKKIPHEIMVEATENGWWYVAPYSEREVTMMFFTLQELLPKKENANTFLQDELNKTIHLSKVIQHIEIDTVKMMPAGTSCLSIPFGKNWLAVGDAAYSYDPISSYGITSALASGFYAGHAVADYLAGKQEAFLGYRYVVENAFSAYMQKLIIHYSREKRWSDSFYWKNRIAHIFDEQKIVKKM
ncbi:putative FAD-dependent oxidoreductase LodB [Kordia sp. SMS9]|uniref:NAD(P)/FAD-dependent oxidoreductase n=1 Tax=Kordia sp. SMS9 TaxID=2282170 RepID=UPI000E0D4197|nr:FAD-dependent monooxygenase [Kordia sp. SMS9]AXG71645.1 putative FAD-dependent oxidoreductase LodB [Kordia sp. SMS9]